MAALQGTWAVCALLFYNNSNYLQLLCMKHYHMDGMYTEKNRIMFGIWNLE